MKDISFHIDSIYRQITQISNITVTHRVKLGLFDKNTSKIKPYVNKYLSNKSNLGKIGISSFYFGETQDTMILSSIDRNSTGQKRIPISVMVSYPESYSFPKMLSDAINDWFDDIEFKNKLFNYTDTGIPYGINSKFSNLHYKIEVVNNFKSEFIAIKPDILLNAKDNIGFPGLTLICSSGIIGSSTVDEMRTIHIMCKNLLDNLYSESLSLIQIATQLMEN